MDTQRLPAGHTVQAAVDPSEKYPVEHIVLWRNKTQISDYEAVNQNWLKLQLSSYIQSYLLTVDRL